MIVGTAGHIDHGKTSLLRALTGIEGDRRPAERQRGITIDLGYLYADLGDGSPTGFIDVPGHERFVHNMLAGASGIDCVLLVVAADDGLMPQTREHLAIVELLGIRRALVALTKIDRVEPQRVQQVRTQVEHLLASGPLARSPIFPLSSSTGEGVEALREALGGLAGEVRERSREGYFRLAVDRAFSVAGSGIVVTGTAFSGQVAVGDELLLGNAGRPVRVRGLHAQNRPAQQAWAGQRVALNIAGERLALEQIQRGDWLLQAALHAPTTRVDIDFRLLPDELRDFTHWTPVHLHLGTQDVTGRLALLEGEQLEPGHRAFAQLVLNAPIQALHGDRLVLRDQSAQRTLGGGRVLDGAAPARNRRTPARLAQLQALRRKAWRRRCRPCSARPRTASTRNAWCNPSTARASTGGCRKRWSRCRPASAPGCSPGSAGSPWSSNCSPACGASTKSYRTNSVPTATACVATPCRSWSGRCSSPCSTPPWPAAMCTAAGPGCTCPATKCA